MRFQPFSVFFSGAVVGLSLVFSLSSSVLAGASHSSLSKNPSDTSEAQRLTLFEQAVRRRDLKIMEKLLIFENRGNHLDYSIMHYCAIVHNPEYLRLYLSITSKSDLNSRTSYGITPLMLALREQNDKAVELLLKQKGVDIHAIQTKDEWNFWGIKLSGAGWSTLMVAAKYASPEGFQMLLDHSKRNNDLLDINHQSEDEKAYALSLLVQKVGSSGKILKQNKKLNLFIAYAGTNLQVNLQDANDKTALIHATWPVNTNPPTNVAIFQHIMNLVEDSAFFLNYNQNAIETLLKQPNIDATIQSKDGYTAMDIALASKSLASVDLYKNHMLRGLAEYKRKRWDVDEINQVLPMIVTKLVQMYAPHASVEEENQLVHWLLNKLETIPNIDDDEYFEAVETEHIENGQFYTQMLSNIVENRLQGQIEGDEYLHA